MLAASVLIMSALPGSAKPNHLIKEKSPYLLQHAYNPVDWRPWGEEAFAKARAEDKPILLSIGYSTCHWCHVMEHESFEDENIAARMNKDFVCIKLDREERPDVDKIYMTAVQAMTGSGGWPLNVFLTPELKPFYGGTYFPPESRWGQPAWPQLLARIAELWRTRREVLVRDSGKMAEAIKESVEVPASSATLVKPDPSWLDRAYAGYEGSFDDVQGGFGGAPKFPMPVNHDLLLRYYARSGQKKALDMSLFTLEAMAKGGVYDQVGGGFHRYSTDAEWLVPHFEKMLYDNAQLASVYLEAYQASGDEELARVARETLDYVLRDMTHPEGGFFSGEDADSIAAKDDKHKAEGAFYVWTEIELRKVLGRDAEAFIKHYGVRPDGNAPSDPHGEFTGKNILHVTDAGKDEWAAAREKLLAVRAKRPRPGLDDKVLTSWNGLMISALAKGAQVLDEPRYLDAAQKSARFIRRKLYDSKTKELFHRWRDGERAIPAISDDYAFLIQGLLDLYEADFDPEHLEWAAQLAEAQDKLFSGPDGGFFMTSADHDKNLLARVMEDVDNVEPSASSVAALNLLRLSHYTDRKDFRAAAEKTLSLFSSRMRERPMSLPAMLSAAAFSLSKVKQVVIATDGDGADMLRAVHRRFLPGKIVILLTPTTRPKLEKLLPFLKNVKPVGGKTAAYVCVDYSCKLPTTDLKVLKDLLDARD